ncbi:uncharacterized protein LOC144341601 [Saccoglossus kowalevskii]
MALVVGMNKLPILIESLHKWRPYCNPVFWMIKNSILTKNVWPCMDIYTDDICNPTTVVGAANNYHEAPFDRSYFMFSTNNNKLEAVLNAAGVIDWDKEQIPFDSIPMSNFQMIQDAATANGFQLIYHQAWQFYLLEKNELCANIADKPLPDGFQFGCLRNEHIPLIEERWWRNNDVPPTILSETLKYHKFHAVFESNGSPIAWGIFKECGDLGYVFCERRYRGSGVPEKMFASMCMMSLNEGIIPYTVLDTRNIHLVKHLRNLGFREVKNFDVAGLVFKKINRI